MLNTWIESTERDPSEYNTFTTWDLSEASSPSDEIKSELARRITDARTDRAFVREAATFLGWDGVRDLMDSVIPTVGTLRKGRFGEVLAQWVLEELHGYAVPVNKLHFALTQNQSLPGTDLLAVKVNTEGTEIVEVCLLESKLRTSADTGCGVEAHDQLVADARQRIPAIYRFTAERLREQGDPLFGAFMEYLRERRQSGGPSDTFRIFLTFDVEPWSETTLVNLHELPPDLAQLAAHKLLVTGLAQLIEDVYGSVGMTSGED